MRVRYWDRRRYIRVPARGPASWCGENAAGYCELMDISPGGAALRVPLRQAGRMQGPLTLEVQLDGLPAWKLAGDARVVRTVPQHEGDCIVGVVFPEQVWGGDAIVAKNQDAAGQVRASIRTDTSPNPACVPPC